MSYLQIIEEIKTNLSIGGFIDISEDINAAQLSGGTGGEVLMIVCHKLLEIERNHKIAFNLIELKSRDLIGYANSVGLFPRLK